MNLPEIAEVWRRGSVIGSWLLDLTANALQKDASSRTTAAASPIRARAAGRSRRRSTKRCRRTC
jgi:6-phosphogluconate dehydrogenase (decarboxylating)